MVRARAIEAADWNHGVRATRGRKNGREPSTGAVVEIRPRVMPLRAIAGAGFPILRKLAQIAPGIDAAVMAVGKGDVERVIPDQVDIRQRDIGDRDARGAWIGVAIDPRAAAIGAAAGGAQALRAHRERTVRPHQPELGPSGADDDLVGRVFGAVQLTARFA